MMQCGKSFLVNNVFSLGKGSGNRQTDTQTLSKLLHQ